MKLPQWIQRRLTSVLGGGRSVGVDHGQAERLAISSRPEMAPMRPRRSPHSRAARRGGRPGPAVPTVGTVIDLFTYVAGRPVAVTAPIAADVVTEDLPFAKTVIGDCTLYHADCRDVLPLLTGIDAVVTDPPYGINVARNGTIGSGSKAIPATRFAAPDWDKEPIAPELMAKLRAKAPWQIIFGGNYYALPPSSCWLVWDKLNTGDLADCELAWTNLNKAVRRIQYRWSGYLRQNNEPRGDHPTQKPIGVMTWCIGHLPGNARTILDPFMGSGTTGVAGVRMGRKFIGIERDKTFFDIACRRIEEAYAQPRLALVAPEPAEQCRLEL
jgi:DNA modification methylase